MIGSKEIIFKFKILSRVLENEKITYVFCQIKRNMMILHAKADCTFILDFSKVVKEVTLYFHSYYML